MKKGKTMRIGITFNPYGGYARYGAEKFKKLAEQGYRAVDYNLTDTDGALYALDEAAFARRMQEERAQAERAGMVVSQVHGPWRYPPRDATEEDRSERMERMKRSIRGARFLGSRYWVIHPIMPFGTHDTEVGKETETWEMNLTFMTELLAYAKEQGVTVCLENMPMLRFSMGRPRAILEFVREMNDPAFKICLDTGHVAVFPDLSLDEVVRELGEEIRVLHVHDNMGDRDAHLWPTEGCIDWEGFAKGLKEIGFNGVFSLEVAPSARLEDQAFEAQSRRLFEIANNIANGE